MQPPPEQTFPHAPQFFGSIRGSTHTPPQAIEMPWQAEQMRLLQIASDGQQVPLQQTPLGQHVPVQAVTVQVVEQGPWPVGQQTPSHS
jgi:hypothetical protein